MKDEIHRINESIIAARYVTDYDRVLRFIAQRVTDNAEAENLAQDVWLKLLECDRPINEATLTSLIYTVARNIVNDYLRHLYIVQDAHGELRQSESIYAQDMESEVVARDLALHEQVRVRCLPAQRRIIYVMSRYEEKSVDEIAAALELSNRTVENHLRLGRKDVRAHMTAIA